MHQRLNSEQSGFHPTYSTSYPDDMTATPTTTEMPIPPPPPFVSTMPPTKEFNKPPTRFTSGDEKQYYQTTTTNHHYKPQTQAKNKRSQSPHPCNAPRIVKKK